MADFFRGLAGGMQTGLQLGQQLRQRRMEDELAKAYAKPEEFVDYTPEQTQEIQRLQSTGAYDVQAIPGTEGAAPTLRFAPRQGLDLQGDMPAAPVDIAPQQVQRFGGQTAAGRFDPTQLRGLQMQEAARVLGSYGDVRGAAALQAQAEEQAFQARERPLRLRALETQVEAGKLGLDKTRQDIERGGIELTAAQRTAAAAKRMDDFNVWRSQNPDADFAAINAEVQRLGMGVEEQFKVASNLTGISEQAFKASQQRIQKLVTNARGLDGLLTAHKESNDLDPGSHFEVTRGKDGRVSLNRVNTATGKIIQPNVFSGSEAETTAYLTRAAMDPATIIDFTMNLEKSRAAIERDRASAEKDRNLGQRYLRDGETEKGLSKKVADVEASLGRKLTEPEKLTLFGLSAKPSDRPEVSPAAVASYAKDLVGKPSGEMKDGKPVRYTAETAAAAARRALSSQGDVVVDPADALIEAMRRNAPPQQRATPAGQSLVNLSNAMLPPAAPAATAPTTSQERLRGLYLGQ